MSKEQSFDDIDWAAIVLGPDVASSGICGDGGRYDPYTFERLDAVQETEEAAVACEPSTTAVGSTMESVPAIAVSDGSTDNAAHPAADEAVEQLMAEMFASTPSLNDLLALEEEAAACRSTPEAAPNAGVATKRFPEETAAYEQELDTRHISSIISVDPSTVGAIAPERRCTKAVFSCTHGDVSINEPSQKRQKKHKQKEEVVQEPTEHPKRNYIYLGQSTNRGNYFSEAHKLFLKEVKVWQCKNEGRTKQWNAYLKDKTNLVGEVSSLLRRVEAKIKEDPVLFYRPSANKCTRLDLDDENATGTEHRSIVRKFLLGHKSPLLKGPLWDAERQLQDYNGYLTEQAFDKMTEIIRDYRSKVSTDTDRREMEETGYLRMLNDIMAKMIRESRLTGGSSFPLEFKHLLNYDEHPGLNCPFRRNRDDDDEDSDSSYGPFAQSSSDCINDGHSSESSSYQEFIDTESDGIDCTQISSDSSFSDTSATATHSLCNEGENSAEGLVVSFSRLSHDDSISDLSHSETFEPPWGILVPDVLVKKKTHHKFNCKHHNAHASKSPQVREEVEDSKEEQGTIKKAAAWPELVEALPAAESPLVVLDSKDEYPGRFDKSAIKNIGDVKQQTYVDARSEYESSLKRQEQEMGGGAKTLAVVKKRMSEPSLLVKPAATLPTLKPSGETEIAVALQETRGDLYPPTFKDQIWNASQTPLPVAQPLLVVGNTIQKLSCNRNLLDPHVDPREQEHMIMDTATTAAFEAPTEEAAGVGSKQRSRTNGRPGTEWRIDAGLTRIFEGIHLEEVTAKDKRLGRIVIAEDASQ